MTNLPRLPLRHVQEEIGRTEEELVENGRQHDELGQSGHVQADVE